MSTRAKLRTWLPLALGLATFPTLNAHAAFVMSLDDLGDSAAPTIIYDGSGNDLSGPNGIITYSGTIGAFDVNVTTGISNPITGPATLNLNSINVTGSSGGSLVVKITDTDFTGSFAELGAGYGGSTEGAIEIEFLQDVYNTEFGGTAFASGAHTSSMGDLHFSEELVGSVMPGEPFSLSIVAVINHEAGGEFTSFEAGIAPVPLPASIWLFGSALAAIGARRRLFRWVNRL